MNSLEALIATHYRWWTVKAWWRHGLAARDVGIKIGPVTVFGYRWLDARWRVSWTFLCGPEYIVCGGPLASENQNVETL